MVHDLPLLFTHLIPRGSLGSQGVWEGSTRASGKELKTGEATPPTGGICWRARVWPHPEEDLVVMSSVWGIVFYNSKHKGQLSMEGHRLRVCERLCF